MTTWHCERLSGDQVRLAESWSPDIRLVTDMSWDLADTVVLHVASGGREYVVKSAGPDNHHIGREITAHQTATDPLVHRERAARMVLHDRGANLLVTEYLGGDLLLGSRWEFDMEVHRQAGELLNIFHSQTEYLDPDADHAATSKALAWLDKPHRIEPSITQRIREVLQGHRHRPVRVVPTHGDWHPRNWLVDNGIVKIIDFGRFDFRPAATDLGRLAAQQWKVAPRLERAFVDGYGSDPRESELWRVICLREAVGTAVWSYQVADRAFEQQGHRMIADALNLF